MPTIDEIASAWRALPSPESTVALCDALRGPGTELLAREVIDRALETFGADLEVLLAAGRVSIRLGWLGEAQGVLTVAGKTNPRDPRAFEELGRVLLLRGDARRAQLALRRATELGSSNPAVPMWHDQAARLGPLQQSDGAPAVAAAIAESDLPWDDRPAVSGVVAAFHGGAPASSRDVSSAPGVEPRATGDDPGAAPFTGASLDDCLLGFERAGVSAARASGSPAWGMTPRFSSAGPRVLVVATLASGAILGVAWAHSERAQADRVAAARVAAAEFRSRLAEPPNEADQERTTALRRLFALDARGAEVASALLADRALGVLWDSSPPTGISAAVARAEAAGSPAALVAAGRIASRLASGDVAGAGELVRRFDAVALDDALYALVSAAALERGGDPRALARYHRAVELDPASVPARVLLARLALLEGAAGSARAALNWLEREHRESLTPNALERLAWAVDPARSGAPPAARSLEQESSALPRPLRATVSLVDAVLTADRGDRTGALEQVAVGLSLASEPAELTALGLVAVRVGDDELGRRAARRIAIIAPEHAGVPVLAARISLLRGRYADAILAVTAGAPRREIALVLAVDAYERFDAAGVRASLAALPGGVDFDPEARALGSAPAALTGEGLPEPEVIHDLTSPRVLWGDAITVDSALDAGRLDLARTLVRAWPQRASLRPPLAVRLARLSRVTGKAESAVDQAARALEMGDATPRAVVELVRALVDVGDGGGARERLEAETGVLGPSLSQWLDVLVTRIDRGEAAATVAAARLPLPPSEAPLVVQALAARALAEAGDLRAEGVVGVLEQRHGAHPDVSAARAVLDAR